MQSRYKIHLDRHITYSLNGQVNDSIQYILSYFILYIINLLSQNIISIHFRLVVILFL